MKSLVEEASTIQKAVEKAWIRAGKPSEFTVKIFEEPKHNFLGMTTRSAKVALFFKNPHSDSSVTESKDSIQSTQKHRERRHERPQNDERPNHRHDRAKMHDTRRQQQPPRHTHNQTTQQAPQQKIDHNDEREIDRMPKQADNRRFDSRRNRPNNDRLNAAWSNEMADIAQDWIENMLGMLSKNDALKEVKIVGEFLKFEFKYPILDDQEKEKALFATWTHLMLATVGNKYKKDLRGLKIILERGE